MNGLRLSILGVGLLGGSVALAARKAMTGCRIKGYGHREETLIRAVQSGVVDESFGDPAAAVADAQLVILCTPVGLFPEMLRQIAPALATGVVVTDVGSTKRSVVAAAELLLPASASFVGSHPMAGSEKRGFVHAHASLLDDALCILTPTSRTPDAAVDFVDSFWRSLKMRTTRLSPEEHDRRLAQVSHLPHALAAAMLMAADHKSLALAGKGLADLTRVAGGDPELWRDILQDNRDEVKQSLVGLIAELSTFAELLDEGRGEALTSWLKDAGQRRSGLPTKPREASERESDAAV